jgi:chorismate lyase
VIRPGTALGRDDDAIMSTTWHSLTPALRRRLPPRVRDWAALGTSMTARIGEVAGAPIEVEVFGQAAGRLLPDERPLFEPGGHAVVREVCLSARGEPLLLARTVFTSRRLQRHPTIVGLGTRPLGSLLFAGGRASPWTVREVARLRPSDPIHRLVRRRQAVVQPATWARRTLFELFGEPLLVTEIFTPALLARA